MWKRCAGTALAILLFAGSANAYDTTAYYKTVFGNHFYPNDVACSGTIEAVTVIVLTSTVNGNQTVAGYILVEGLVQAADLIATDDLMVYDDGTVTGNIHYMAILKP